METKIMYDTINLSALNINVQTNRKTRLSGILLEMTREENVTLGKVRAVVGDLARLFSYN